MNYFIITIILSVSIYANEIERMESIVEDIKDLRLENSKCQKELDAKNVIFIDDTKSVDNKKTENIELEKLKLENIKLQEYKNLLNEIEIKNKEIEIENMLNIEDIKSKYDQIIFSKDEEIKNLKEKNTLKIKNKISACKDENIFPSLIMKEKTKPKVSEVVELEVFSRALTYRLNKDSNIYSTINGKKILDIWEEKTSFTSNIMSKNWVKITGYFKDGKWGKSKKDLWIKKVNTSQR